MSNKTIDVKRWVIVGLLALGAIIAYIDRSNISVALAVPEFINHFDLNDLHRGLLNSAFFWSYTILQIAMGYLVDRFGVKKPYTIGFLIWCVAAAATAFTNSLSQLISLRVLLGAGEAVVVPATYRWIRYNFVEKERGLAMGLYMTGTKIASAIGAPIAAWLIVAYNWQYMFLILGLIGLVWLIPWLILVKEPKTREERDTTPREGASEKVPLGKTMASPVVLGAVIVNFCYMYFTFFNITWMPAYFVEARNLSLKEMGLFTFLSFGGMAIIATAAGWAADRLIARGKDPVLVRKTFIICGFAIASTELIGAQSASVNAALFWAVISLSGLGLASANSLALTRGTLIPATAVGLVSGVQNCFGAAAGIVGPILTGWLKEISGGYVLPMQAIWIFMILGILSTAFLLREKYAPMKVKK
jgi:MFS family permease